MFIHFDNYSGPLYPGTQAVPIVPILKSWVTNGKRCSRYGFPLILAWSMTVHKCQGLELDTVRINIGSKEMSPGLTFVAVSRVRRLQDVFFRPHFPYHRLSSIGRMNGIKQRVAEMDRFHSLSLIDNEPGTC
jgi:ATP-dependent DNA helicase PIF1